MISTIENVTTSNVGLALDAAVLRHQVIATNIANVNTPGYTPRRLSFVAQMSELQTAVEMQNVDFPHTNSESNFVVSPALDIKGLPAKVELDMEVAAMAQNSVHYQSLVRALSRHYAILGSAVSDGKK